MKSHGLLSIREILLSLINQQTQQQEKEMKDQLEALVKQMHSTGILYSEAVREFKKRFIMNVLQACKGNQCRAARELGMHRNTLSRAIVELKLDVRQFRRYDKRRKSVVKAVAIAPKIQELHGEHRTQFDYTERLHVCGCGDRFMTAKDAAAHEQLYPVAETLAAAVSKIGPEGIKKAMKGAAKVGA